MSRMRSFQLFITFALGAIALVLIACNSASTKPIGLFKIPKSPYGTTSLTLQADGRFVLGGNDVRGKYEINGDEISFVEDGGSSAACVGTLGKYKWSLNNQILTLQKVDDSCSFRADDFQDPMPLQQ